GVDRAYLVGLSMGGMVAQHVALTYPDRLDGLVLMATTPGIIHGGLPTLRALRSLLRVSFGRRNDRVAARELVADLILSRGSRDPKGHLELVPACGTGSTSRIRRRWPARSHACTRREPKETSRRSLAASGY